MHKRTASLQKTITRLVLVGYIILLLLLVFMDYFMIRNYQRSLQSQEQQVVEETLKEISDSMEYVRTRIFEIYSYNAKMQVLAEESHAGAAYSHAYDLRREINNQLMLDDRWHGFYLLYNNNRESMYCINGERIPAGDASRIYQMLLQSLGGGNSFTDTGLYLNRWNCIRIEERVYLLIGVQKKGASAFGVINLSSAEEKLAEKAGISKLELYFLEDFRPVFQKAEKDEILKEYMTGSKTYFSYRRFGDEVTGNRLGTVNIWAVTVNPLDLTDYVTWIHLILITITFGSCGLAFGVYFYLKKNIILPLEHLRLKMEAVRRNRNNKALLVEAHFEELMEVDHTLNAMLDELEQQKVMIYETAIEKQKAELQFLQLQSKPHFYLNGLKAIHALVLNGQKESALKLIYSLSEHFRFLLQTHEQTIPLEKEIAFTRNYCSVMGQMTGRKMHLDTVIQEDCLPMHVPVLAIQTFVENSIKYAKLGSMEAVLEIGVEILKLENDEGCFLDVMISDNGCGYAEEILEAINQNTITEESHIGIGNLKKRCGILYEEKAEFAFYNDRGAHSELIFPVMTAERKELDAGFDRR